MLAFFWTVGTFKVLVHFLENRSVRFCNTMTAPSRRFTVTLSSLAVIAPFMLLRAFSLPLYVEFRWQILSGRQAPPHSTLLSRRAGALKLRLERMCSHRGKGCNMTGAGFSWQPLHQALPKAAASLPAFSSRQVSTKVPSSAFLLISLNGARDETFVGLFAGRWEK